MSSTAYTLEVITMNYALEALTFRSTDNIYELGVIFDDISHGNGVSELEFSIEISCEFHQLFLRSGSCLFEVPL